MVLSNAERQKRYREKLKDAANASYEAELIRRQIGLLEQGLNEARVAAGLPEIQLPKSAHKPPR